MPFRFVLDERVEPQVLYCRSESRSPYFRRVGCCLWFSIAAVAILLTDSIRYLEREGHDAIHVRETDELGAGADDSDVAAYSASTERHILTNDDDFFTELTDDLPTVFYFPNQRLSAYKIASIIEILDQQFVTAELEREPVVKVVEEWF